MDPSNVINFGLLVVTAVSAIIAIIAVVDARKSRTAAAADAEAATRSADRAATAAEGIERALVAQGNSERRVRRSDFARDLMIWFDQSTVPMILGGDVAILVEGWSDTAEQLSARARVIDSLGANNPMIAAREARVAVERIPIERRMKAAMQATDLLKLYAEQWVDDPREVDYAIVQWIEDDDEIERTGDLKPKRTVTPGSTPPE